MLNVNYNIYSEDCIEGMKKLDDQSVDFILTDLPYGIMSYNADKKIDLSAMWEQFKRILKPRCVVALFANSRFTIELAASNFEWYKYKYVWIKNFSTNFVNAKNFPMRLYEEILIFSGGVPVHEGQSDNKMRYYPQGLKPATESKVHGVSTICLSSHRHNQNAKKKFGTTIHTSPSNVKEYTQQLTGYPTDVLCFDAPYNVKRLHPNQKPVPLLEYLIKTYSNEGETVLDATMGSGSTGVACINTNRNFVGYETNPEYYEAAKKRMVQAFNDKDAALWSDYYAEKS